MYQKVVHGKKNKKSLTQIELMVVIAIIGVFALVGLLFHLSQQVRVEEAFSKDYADAVEFTAQ